MLIFLNLYFPLVLKSKTNEEKHLTPKMYVSSPSHIFQKENYFEGIQNNPIYEAKDLNHEVYNPYFHDAHAI